MKIFRLRTINHKVLSVVLMTTLVALVIALAAIVLYDLRADRRTFVFDMQTQAELLGHMTAPALNFDDKQLARQNLYLLSIRPSILGGGDLRCFMTRCLPVIWLPAKSTPDS